VIKYLHNSPLRFLSLLLLLNLWAVNVAGAFHFHKVESSTKEDCGVCHFYHQVSSSKAVDFQKTHPSPYWHSLSLVPIQSSPSFSIHSLGKLSQAPPLS